MKSTRLAILCCTLLACSACSLKIGDGTFVSSESSSSVSSVSSEDAIAPFISLPPESQKILSGADALHVPLHATKAGYLYLLTKSGLKTIRMISSDASINRLNPEGLFTYYDMVFADDGTDKSSDYAFLQKQERTFPIDSYLRIDDDHFAYGIHPAYGSGAGIHIRTISDGSEKVLPIAAAGLHSNLEGLLPLCISADGRSMYVQYQGWEGFSYGGVWNVRLSDLHVEKIFALDDDIYRYHCRERSDLIVGVKTGYRDGYDMGGTSWSPSSVVLFNGATKTSKTLVASEGHLFSEAFISPDGLKIVGIEVTPRRDDRTSVDGNIDNPFEMGATKEVFMMDIDGSNKHVVGSFDDIVGVSRDASVFITKRRTSAQYPDDNEQYFITNANDGKTVQFGSGSSVTTVPCAYGTAFDCDYR